MRREKVFCFFLNRLDFPSGEAQVWLSAKFFIIPYNYLSGSVAASALQGCMGAPVKRSVGVVATSSPSPVRDLGGVEGVSPTMAVLWVHVVHGAFLTATIQITISFI